MGTKYDIITTLVFLAGITGGDLNKAVCTASAERLSDVPLSQVRMAGHHAPYIVDAVHPATAALKHDLCTLSTCTGTNGH